jgi:hypothetical protein
MSFSAGAFAPDFAARPGSRLRRLGSAFGGMALHELR